MVRVLAQMMASDWELRSASWWECSSGPWMAAEMVRALGVRSAQTLASALVSARVQAWVLARENECSTRTRRRRSRQRRIRHPHWRNTMLRTCSIRHSANRHTESQSRWEPTYTTRSLGGGWELPSAWSMAAGSVARLGGPLDPLLAKDLAVLSARASVAARQTVAANHLARELASPTDVQTRPPHRNRNGQSAALSVPGSGPQLHP